MHATVASAVVCLAGVCVPAAGYLAARGETPASHHGLLGVDPPAIEAGPAREVAGAATNAGPRWTTEQAWIVAEIAGALVNMTAPAPTVHRTARVRVEADPRATGRAGYTIRVPSGRTLSVDITDHIWAPQHYVPVAVALLPRSRIAACDSASPLVGRLLDLEADVIQRENIRISARLKTDMRCAPAHEEAALLLGALALREAAGPFSDPRRLLSRMTAHLAMADAVQRASPGLVRRLADAVLLTLAGRERSALELLAALDPPDSDLDLQAWVRVLRLRNTGDWRILPEPRRATLIEQLELLRATAARLGDGRARRLYESFQAPRNVPDWGRVFLQGRASVEAGNQFGASAVPAELAEAQAVRRSYAPAVALDDLAALVKELTAEPGHGPIHASGDVWVIEWGMWAASAERHILMALSELEDHLHRMLGLPERAAELRTFAKRFSPLRLYPVLAVTTARSAADRREAVTAAGALAELRPELLTDSAWSMVLAKGRELEPPHAVRSSSGWFTSVILPGTAFDVASRVSAEGRPPLDATTIAELRGRAPYAPSLVWETLRTFGSSPPHGVLRREFGAALAYDRHYAARLARRLWDNEDAYVGHMEVLARLDPDSRAELADYLADRGRWEEASSQAERYVKEAIDQVGVSRSVTWLLRYYHDRGERDKATTHADRVAEVHSYAGLVARANLHDWRGELDDAERFYRTAAERYDDWADLLAFHIRNRHTRRGHDDLVRKIFPEGLSEIVFSRLTGVPVDGVEVTYTGASGYRAGIRAGDIIVGVDGFLVRNLAQYQALRNANAAPAIDFVVWRNGEYRRLNMNLRHTWIISRLRTYQPKAGRRTNDAGSGL